MPIQRHSNLLPAALGVLAMTALLAASPCRADVYKWVDKQGQTHYSDLPPPDGSKYQTAPVGNGAMSDTKTPSTAAPAVPSTAPSESKTSALRGKMIGVEQVDNSPEAQRQRAENCQRMKSELAIMSSDNRVFTLDAKGERQYVDDATRSARRDELQKQIASGCN